MSDCECGRPADAPLFEVTVTKGEESPDGSAFDVLVSTRAHVHGFEEFDAVWSAMRQAMEHLAGSRLAHEVRN